MRLSIFVFPVLVKLALQFTQSASAVLYSARKDAEPQIAHTHTHTYIYIGRGVCFYSKINKSKNSQLTILYFTHPVLPFHFQIPCQHRLRKASSLEKQR